MEIQELLWTALRAAGVYAFMLIVVRLLGKREVGSFSAFDLLVALMLGEVVDEVIYGDVVPWQGMVAVVVIGAVHALTGWAACANQWLGNLLEGKPAVVVEHGEMKRDAMAKERMSEEDLTGLLREQTVDDLREVRLATLERTGMLSVLKEEWAEPLQKADLGGEEAKQKEADTGGREEPPEEKQTYSRRALAA